MTIRRTIVIPAILALSVAGSIAAGSTVSVGAAQTTSIHVVAAAPATSSGTRYNW
jgi:hypothetical protein